ncbi:5476_t:CDS:2, partial [Entrophospora sp. SA101]
DDLYSAEVDQTVNGSFVYGATPIETTTKNTFETTSASIEKMAKVEAEVEAEEDISLNFEGEDKDTFVLISGLWGFDTIEINLPGGKNYTIADYWSDVKEIVEDPIIVKPSPLGSVHDRAVEIFYQLKGGQVDYGLSHSHRFCHKQLGQTYDGVIPDWDAENPIVLIGKGYGATTALHLQHLLETNFFGQNTSGTWIKAIICLSAPHRGSTLPYLLGLEPGSKCIVHPLSILQFILSMVHLICYFACLERFFSFQLLSDKWNLRRKGCDGGEQSIWSAISARSRFAYFGDNFLVDWSVEGARMRYAGEEKDKHCLNSSCVYINYITTGQSWRSKVTGYYWPRLSWNNIPTFLISFFLGRYKFSSDSEQQVLQTSSSTFWENNGTLSTYSQLPPPHQPIHMNLVLNEKLFDPVEHQLQPGAWYNLYVDDRAHTILFADKKKNQQQKLSSLSSTISRFLPSIIINNKKLIPQQIYDLKIIKQFNDSLYFGNSNENFETSDKAALEWMTRVETTGVLSSPSRLLYWMNQSHYAVADQRNKVQQNDGPMFIRARHKMTAEDYKATVMNGNAISSASIQPKQESKESDDFSVSQVEVTAKRIKFDNLLPY